MIEGDSNITSTSGLFQDSIFVRRKKMLELKLHIKKFLNKRFLILEHAQAAKKNIYDKQSSLNERVTDHVILHT